MAGCVKSKITFKNYLTTKARMKTKNSIAASGVKNLYLSSFLFSDLKFSKIVFFSQDFIIITSSNQR